MNPQRPYPYFLTPEAQQQFLAEVHRWLGTPFQHFGRILGVGVDCVHLWGEVMVACGHLERYEFPEFTHDGGHHAEESPLHQWFIAHPKFKAVHTGDALMIGDLITYRIGKVPWHLVGCIGHPHGVHVMQGGRVTQMRLDDSTFTKRAMGAFRPVFA